MSCWGLGTLTATHQVVMRVDVNRRTLRVRRQRTASKITRLPNHEVRATAT